MKHCHWCAGKLEKIISFGPMPIVNYFPKSTEVKHENRYPLTLCVCRACGLAQVKETISPTILFRRYHYVTGASGPLVHDLRQFAHKHQARKVLDIGSNDGTLLTEFQKHGSVVLGVEPATSIKTRVPTIHDFFSYTLAKKIKKTHGTFDLITATHVLANIPDLHDFLRGVKEVLSARGTFIVEVGSLEDMMTYGQFDSIYHEHYSYFSKYTLSTILADAGFRAVNTQKLKTQGGSIRVTAVKGHALPLAHKPEDFQPFTAKMNIFRTSLRSIIKGDFRGKTVVGFGAPAKGVTLLNYCGLGVRDIAFVVDSTVQKQGRLVPGVHIPVYAEEKLAQIRPDAILILSWNYRDEILRKIKKQVKRTVAVITPFPILFVTTI